MSCCIAYSIIAVTHANDTMLYMWILFSKHHRPKRLEKMYYFLSNLSEQSSPQTTHCNDWKCYAGFCLVTICKFCKLKIMNIFWLTKLTTWCRWCQIQWTSCVKRKEIQWIMSVHRVEILLTVCVQRGEFQLTICVQRGEIQLTIYHLCAWKKNSISNFLWSDMYISSIQHCPPLL